jgi:UDP-N-acetylglucosamine--N-acetylmuramyl-(pentapeptide) pyrophosphoryl-undecaprenol N-acetylglucosamine transferase
MRIVFVGGGTGGHFYPLMAIAEAVRTADAASGRNSQLYYMGPGAYSRDALNEHQVTFVYCPAGKIRRYRSLRNISDLFVTAAGLVIAFFKLLRLYPDVIMSKGGFTSVPVVIAAWLLRIPIVIHESDAVPGRANRLAAPLARYIGVAHDDVASFFPTKKVALVGMPVSQSFFQQHTDPFAAAGIPNDRPVILVTGGSLGAERLNDFVIAALPQLLTTYTVVHQAGAANEVKVTETAAALINDPELLGRYFVLGHVPHTQFSALQQLAHVIITRGGSTTLFEIALRGKPAIVIPIPEDVSRDQRSNAYAYARSGAATVLEEDNISDDLLVSELRTILDDSAVYQRMAAAAAQFTVPTAATSLAEILITIGQEHE